MNTKGLEGNVSPLDTLMLEVTCVACGRQQRVPAGEVAEGIRLACACGHRTVMDESLAATCRLVMGVQSESYT